MNALRALLWREFIRQFRQPTRVVATIATPAMIWVFFAAGFAGSTNLGVDASMRAFLVPGIASLTVLFASIFASISLIQDRQEGFLRAAMVSPAPRWAVAGSKVAAGTVSATAQGLVVLLMLPLVGHPVTVAGVAAASLVLACISGALIGLGLCLAWRVDSTQGFHGVMNTVLMPLWLLSGAVFPIATAAGWLAWIARLNPLTWCHEAMRHALGMSPATNEALAWGLTVGFAAAGVGAAWWTIGRGRTG